MDPVVRRLLNILEWAAELAVKAKVAEAATIAAVIKQIEDRARLDVSAQVLEVNDKRGGSGDG